MPTNNSINTQYLASSATTKAGTSTLELISPSAFSSYMDDMSFSGRQSWTGAGNYFNDSTLGSFSILRGGTGYIKGKLISWSPQTITGLTAGNTYYIYIDSTGTIQKTTSFSDALYAENIVLFECMRDSTPVTNNQITVREDHAHNFPAECSTFLHESIGPVISNMNNGANITLNGTQKIQINGSDFLLDHGLETTIADSAGVGVTWRKYYTTAGGKWALYSNADTFAGTYNNGGTPTALGASKFGVYTLYCSKDNLTTSTPLYFAVLDTSQYNSLGLATTAISNGTTAKSSNELSALEVCQLGYIVFSQSSSSIVAVIISKSTIRQTLSTAGTNQASLVNTSTTNFNGWLNSADTNVQTSLDELDDSCRFVEVTGATQAMAVNRSYSANRATAVAFTLPVTAIVGDEVAITGIGNGGWTLAQNANQYINIISATTTVGVGGSLASTNKFDSVRLVCTTTNNGWNVISMMGNITYV